jgi:hypothetical protein
VQTTLTLTVIYFAANGAGLITFAFELFGEEKTEIRVDAEFRVDLRAVVVSSRYAL